MNPIHKLSLSLYAVLLTLLSGAAIALAQDAGSSLDFTTGDLETIGPIQAKADKPQVVISRIRVAPEFKKFEIDERNFVQDVLKTATNRELHKKFKEKAFTVDVPPIE